MEEEAGLSPTSIRRLLIFSLTIIAAVSLVLAWFLRWLHGPAYLNVPIIVAVSGVIGTWVNVTKSHLSPILEIKRRFLQLTVPLLALVLVLAVTLSGIIPRSTRQGLPESHIGDVAQSAADVPPVSDVPPPSDGTPVQSPICQNSQSEPSSPWGPDRPLLSTQPIIYQRDLPKGKVPAFNDIEMGPQGNFGRNDDLRMRLITAKDAADTEDNGYLEEVSGVDENKTYRVRVMVLNTAALGSGLNARDTRLWVYLPECRSTSITVVGTITSSNSNPPSVWGSVRFDSDRPFRMVPDTQQAKIIVGSAGNIHNFSDTARLFGPTGTLLGTNMAAPDGTVTPGYFIDFLLYLKPHFRD